MYRPVDSVTISARSRPASRQRRPPCTSARSRSAPPARPAGRRGAPSVLPPAELAAREPTRRRVATVTPSRASSSCTRTSRSGGCPSSHASICPRRAPSASHVSDGAGSGRVCTRRPTARRSRRHRRLRGDAVLDGLVHGPPFARVMGPGSLVIGPWIARVMGPVDRQGHGATRELSDG